jgi:hypothetical protein
MSRCDDLRRDAAGLAALAQDHPERLEAHRHAEGCVPCKEALREATQLWTLLSYSQAPPPSTEVLQRASAEILSQFDDRLAAGRSSVAIGLGMVLSWTAMIALAKEREPEHLLWSAILLGLATGLALAIFRLAKIFAVLVGLVSAAAAVFLAEGLSSGFASGVRCLAFEAAAGLIPFGVATVIAFRRTLDGGRMALVAAAMGGGLAGQAALHVACHGRMLDHLALYHAGGVLALGLAAYAIASLPPLRRALEN